AGPLGAGHAIPAPRASGRRGDPGAARTVRGRARGVSGRFLAAQPALEQPRAACGPGRGADLREGRAPGGVLHAAAGGAGPPVTTVLLLGATGRVGGQVLRLALAHPQVSRVVAPTRRPLAVPAAG